MQNFNFYTVKLVKDKSVSYETISSASDAAKIGRSLIGDAAEEHFVVLGLNTKGQVTNGFTVSIGDVSSAIVSPREIFKRLIAGNCSSFICFHNHPSGIPDFSNEDRVVTKRLQDCGNLLGIKLLDHIVVTDDDMYVSATAEGLL